MKRIKDKGTSVITYEPIIGEYDLYNTKVITNLNEFKYLSKVIVANYMDADIIDVVGKVYIRDLYFRD